MSLFDTFDPDSEEILKPSSMYSPQEGFPETVVLTFSDKTIHILQDICETETVATLRGGRPVPVYKFSWNGKDVGSCGVLDASLAAGRFIIPTAAYRDEGTSYHYMPVSDYVDIPTAQRLGEIFDELHLPYVQGRVWTIDAFYRETRNNMEKRKADGCIAVDMECASVMAVAQFRGAEIYQFIYAEDCLDGATWDRRTLGNVSMSTREKYLRIALEVASRL